MCILQGTRVEVFRDKQGELVVYGPAISYCSNPGKSPWKTTAAIKVSEDDITQERNDG